MDGGDRIARVLQAQGVPALFTLCGGHISPILVAAKRRGIRIVDVRHEASAVFAADALARRTGIPGVAAVTAGPGVTNTITALQNAQMAQSPVVVLGGATPTLLRGRGSLQDIDQITLVRPLVKWITRVTRLRDLEEKVDHAFRRAQEGVPGPVFVEVPVDLLYAEPLVRELYAKELGRTKGLMGAALKRYVGWHLGRQFGGASPEPPPHSAAVVPRVRRADADRVVSRLGRAERPVLLLGSQAMLEPRESAALARAVERLGVPTYLGGMSRGLLGADSPLQFRHRRRDALRAADLVILAGFPCDFRLGYGRIMRSTTPVVAVNRDAKEARKNRRPSQLVVADPGRFLRELAERFSANGRFDPWLREMRERESEREADIAARAAAPTDFVNPLALCQALERVLTDRSIVVADGGDFVATASYIVRPRGPLRWLDPGVFGTLGVGGGFAIGASIPDPRDRVWLLYGDGSAGYSLAEFDSFVRHGLPVIAIVGTDGSWAQIAREQVAMLGDDVGTTLSRTDYHRVAEGFGGRGILVQRPGEVEPALRQAGRWADEGHPVLLNVLIGQTDFRKGSISL